MITLYFASSNKHKFLEFRRMLEDLVDLKWIQVEYLEPQANDLIEVATTSALWLSEYLPEPFFLEDAGLFIKALGGFPGPYSSYVFDSLGNDGILRLMSGVKERSAVFSSVIALHVGNSVITFEGRVAGYIAEGKRGGGWGFDPIFIPEGSNGLTFGELGEDKDRFSHRGRSTDELRKFLMAKGEQFFKNDEWIAGKEG